MPEVEDLTHPPPSVSYYLLPLLPLPSSQGPPLPLLPPAAAHLHLGQHCASPTLAPYSKSLSPAPPPPNLVFTELVQGMSSRALHFNSLAILSPCPVVLALPLVWAAHSNLSPPAYWLQILNPGPQGGRILYSPFCACFFYGVEGPPCSGHPFP